MNSMFKAGDWLSKYTKNEYSKNFKNLLKFKETIFEKMSQKRIPWIIFFLPVVISFVFIFTASYLEIFYVLVCFSSIFILCFEKNIEMNFDTSRRLLIILFLLVGIPFLISYLSYIIPFKSIGIDRSHYLKISGILAGLSALLITILVFSLEIRREEIPGEENLMKLFVDYLGFLLISAFF